MINQCVWMKAEQRFVTHTFITAAMCLDLNICGICWTWNPLNVSTCWVCLCSWHPGKISTCAKAWIQHYYCRAPSDVREKITWFAQWFGIRRYTRIMITIRCWEFAFFCMHFRTQSNWPVDFRWEEPCPLSVVGDHQKIPKAQWTVRRSSYHFAPSIQSMLPRVVTECVSATGSKGGAIETQWNFWARPCISGLVEVKWNPS